MEMIQTEGAGTDDCECQELAASEGDGKTHGERKDLRFLHVLHSLKSSPLKV